MIDGQTTTHAQLFDLTGKRASSPAAPGASGLMIARGLLQAGARVVISSRKADACAQARGQLSEVRRRRGGPRRPVPHDECDRLAGLVTADLGRPRHPRQQRGRHVGRAAGRRSRTPRGTRSSTSTSSRRSGWCRRCCRHFAGWDRRRSRADHQHRQHRRHPRPHCPSTRTPAARLRCINSPECSPMNSARSTSR